MAAQEFYRGGSSLKPKPREVRIDPNTGLLETTHGVSVRNAPDKLAQFGGAYRVVSLPSELQIIKRGHDPAHYEIVPVYPMTMAEFEEALSKVVLVRV